MSCKKCKDDFSRREVLSGAAKGATIYTLSPLLYGLLKSEAAEAANPDFTANTRLIVLALQGGYGVYGSFVGRVAGGGYIPASVLPNHGVQNLDITSNPSQLLPFANLNMYSSTISGLSQGIVTYGATPTVAAPNDGSMRAQALAATSVTLIPNSSGDDTSKDENDNLSLATEAGVHAAVADTAGTTNNPSGGQMQPLIAAPSRGAFAFAQSPNDIIGLANLSQAIPNRPGLFPAIAAALNKLSTVQLANRQPDSRSQAAAEKAMADYQGLIIKADPNNPIQSAGLNPANDATDAVPVFNINVTNFNNALMQNNTTNAIQTIVYNAILGNIGPSCITLGGYDYHGSTQHRTQDMNAGLLIGQIIELAYRKKQNVLLAVKTDGGLAAAPFNTANYTTAARWSGDRGPLYGGTVLIHINGSGNGPTFTTNSVGHMRSDNGAVDTTSSPTAVDPRSASALIHGLWLLLNGQYSSNTFDNVLTKAGYNSAQIAAIGALVRSFS